MRRRAEASEDSFFSDGKNKARQTRSFLFSDEHPVYHRKKFLRLEFLFPGYIINRGSETLLGMFIQFFHHRLERQDELALFPVELYRLVFGTL